MLAKAKNWHWNLESNKFMQIFFCFSQSWKVYNTSSGAFLHLLHIRLLRFLLLLLTFVSNPWLQNCKWIFLFILASAISKLTSKNPYILFFQYYRSACKHLRLWSIISFHFSISECQDLLQRKEGERHEVLEFH